MNAYRSPSPTPRPKWTPGIRCPKCGGKTRRGPLCKGKRRLFTRGCDDGTEHFHVTCRGVGEYPNDTCGWSDVFATLDADE